MKIFILSGLVLFAITTALAQDQMVPRKKGDFYFYWGYNRALYSHTNIKFSGPGYEFEISDVSAIDKPLSFSFENYFKLTNISIPQYVYRVGYFITDKWSVSLGMDHMKYVMNQNQTVKINGTINEPNNPYNGTYVDDDIVLTPAFLEFEHTDGLNYLNASADYYYDIYTNPTQSFTISAFGGGGIGMLIPKSNVVLMSSERNDQFHIAGYGFHGDLGLNFSFWRHLFFRSQLKGGFVHLPDVLTRPGGVPDRANHGFWFGMWDFALGWQWSF